MSHRWADQHVYDQATMLCQACRRPWVCDDGKERLLEEFAHRDPRHLTEVLAETAAIAVQVLKPATQAEINEIHTRIRGWVGVDG